MRFTRLAILAAVAAALAVPATAQSTGNVDTVILASTANYPDALVGAAPGAKLGIPVLLTQRDGIPSETQRALERMQPSEVVVLGGPSVVSEQVTAALEQEYAVTRLWGTTRYGTAVEVAEQFWVEGADEALLVQNGFDDRSGRVLAAAKEIARDGEMPVYLTPEDGVPAVVLSSLESLGVGEVTVVGRTVSDSYRASLQDVNVTVDETITAEDDEELEAELQDRATQDVNASTELLAVASGDGFRQRIAAANTPRGEVYHIGGTGDIDALVTFVQDRGVERVKVVGRPQLADGIAQRLRSDTDATVDLVVGQAAAATSANLTTSAAPEFARVHDRRAQAWQQARQEHRAAIRERVNRTIQRAERFNDTNASDEVRAQLGEARRLFRQGDYEEAREAAQDAASEARRARFEELEDDPAALQDSIRDETEDLQERVDELRALNKEFADEMEENMTVEERLEVIEEFRDRRRETVRALVEQARQVRGHRGDVSDRLREARKRVRTTGERFRFEAECGDGGGTFTVQESRIQGEDGRIDAEATLGLNVPTYRADYSRAVDEEARTLSLTVDLTERSGPGIDCVGVAEFEYRRDVRAGDWTVDVTVRRGDDELTFSDTVTVTRDDDDGMETTPVAEMPAACAEDVRAAREAAEGRTCTEQYQLMRCPDDDSVVYGAANGCEISALQERGWTAARFPDDDDGTDDEENETSEPAEDDEPAATVTYSSDGFSPQRVTVDEGETVVWESEGPDMWVASAVHPTHTEYAGSSRSEHCENGDATGPVFDQCRTAQTYSFTFEKEGNWGYHNHVNSAHSGTVVVE